MPHHHQNNFHQRYYSILPLVSLGSFYDVAVFKVVSLN